MTKDTATQVICKKGTKRPFNADFFVLAHRDGTAFIVLVDISTSSPFDVRPLQDIVSIALEQGIKSQFRCVSCEYLLKIVSDIQIRVDQAFTRGCASILMCAVSKIELVGCTLGDVRLGKALFVENKLNEIEWVTPVHSAVNPFGPFEEAMKNLPSRHVLTNCLKAHRKNNPEVFQIATQPKDMFVIASDGFWCEIAPKYYFEALTSSAHTEDDCSAILFSVETVTSEPWALIQPNSNVIVV